MYNSNSAMLTFIDLHLQLCLAVLESELTPQQGFARCARRRLQDPFCMIVLEDMIWVDLEWHGSLKASHVFKLVLPHTVD